MDQHDVANVVAIICGNIELMLQKCQTCSNHKDCENKDCMKEVLVASERLMRIARGQEAPANGQSGPLELPNGDYLIR